MANPHPKTSEVPPCQSALNKVLINKIYRECDIPSDCVQEVLGSQYENWKIDPNVLLPGSIVVSKLHLQNLRLPLPPFFHYFFVILDIHPLQLSGKAI